MIYPRSNYKAEKKKKEKRLASMKEDNNRRGQALLCPIPSVHFPENRVRERARNHQAERFPSRHSSATDIFHQREALDSPLVFSTNLSLPSSHESVSVPCPPLSFLPFFLPSRALTRETRAKRVVVAGSLLPLDL